MRTTLTYRVLPTLTAGLEYNPIANDIGPIANWLALPEQHGWPALIVGTSSDRIGTSHGRSFYGTFSKDLEEWTGLPIAPYVGAAFGTFDDELNEIAGLSVRWSESVSTTSLWDGHNLHHIVETYVGDRHTFGLVIANLDGHYDLGVSYSIGF
ncbi:MAG: hypothetical protein SGI72_18215 [Planctomycetota bacterium]|nr:hypothetical protein [Planctomycetota bacterium]